MNIISLHFRKGDLLAAGFVLLLVLISALLLPRLTADSSRFAQIYQDGALVREVPLDVEQTFQIRGSYTNTVTVQDGKIAVTHSDCPTGDCVRQGWLSVGGTIICLPNRVEIRLSSDSDVDISIK